MAESWGMFRESYFPMWELKPLERWCPANLIGKVTSQISVFCLSVSFAITVSHCASFVACPSPYAFFSLTPSGTNPVAFSVIVFPRNNNNSLSFYYSYPVL